MSIFENLLQSVGAVKPVAALSPIHAGYGELLFDSSGGVITIYKIFGALRRFEGEERQKKLNDFERYLATWNSKGGYYMTLIHEHSVDGLRQQIDRSHNPMRATMNRINMPSASHMLDSREMSLDGKLHHEVIYLAIHTTTGVLPEKEKKIKSNNHAGVRPGQSTPYFEKLHDLHGMYQFQVEGALKGLTIQFEKLTAKKGAAIIGEMWSRREVSENSIKLIGDHINKLASNVAYRKGKNGYVPIFNLSEFAFPPLSKQLFTDKVYYPADRDDFFLLNGHYHAALRMTQAPGAGSVKKYNELRNRLPPDTNYRLSIQLASGSNASSALAAKRILSIMTGNVDVAKSIDELKSLSDAGIVSSGLKIMCATWASDPKVLERNVDKLHSAFQLWGGSSGSGAKLVTMTDQPDRAVAQTLPGAIQRGATTFMPVALISEILPIEIATSPWREGLIMRSGESQAYPIDPGDDSLLDFHVYVLIGGTGKGKSVTMTELLKACMFRNGLEKIPYTRYLDVGYTSKALFTFFRYMLPDEMKHEVVHYTIQNSSHFCLNGFDTPLGMREPTPKEASFLGDTIGSYLAGTGGVEGLAASMLFRLGSQLVPEAYRLTSDGNALCKTYFYPDEQPELIEALERHQINPVSGVTTWYEIVDLLFEAGENRLASVAQRYASPTIPDLLSVMSESTSIQESFGEKVVEGTQVLEYAQTILQSMLEQFPALCGRTRLDIEEARMIGIDMQDVAHNKEETGLFYMMLQNILSRGFMSDPDEVRRLNMPEQYREHHRKRLQELRNSSKIFAFDELHRLSQGLEAGAKPPKAMMLLMRWIKEVRKYDIKLLLATQAIDHMPAEIKDEAMWSLFFCMGVDSIPGQRKLADMFDISEYGQDVLGNLIGPEAGKGARCLFLANTKHGRIEQDLYITTSPFELWAAPTKAKNLALMNACIEKIGDPTLTARALTACFPKGSAETDMNLLVEKEGKTESEAKAILLQRALDQAEAIRLNETSTSIA